MVEVGRCESTGATGALRANGLCSVAAAPPLSVPDLRRLSVAVRSHHGFLSITFCGFRAFSYAVASPLAAWDTVVAGHIAWMGSPLGSVGVAMAFGRQRRCRPLSG